MNWFVVGIVVIFALAVFLAMFFWSSGALAIDDEEKKDIEQKSTEELVDELIEVEKEDLADLKAEEDETRGFQ